MKKDAATCREDKRIRNLGRGHVKAKPLTQIKIVLTGRQPDLEEMFGEAARRHEFESKRVMTNG